MPLTPAALATLRRYIAEPTEANYTDALLDSIYDGQGGDLEAAASEIWLDKAAKSATLVDISEGNSSRKNSQVYNQALKQATFFGASAAAVSTAGTRSARTRAIERP
jgi:DNA polymerase III delta prime subunit